MRGPYSLLIGTVRNIKVLNLFRCLKDMIQGHVKEQKKKQEEGERDR